MGFGQGVSGINAAAQNLDVIGNNIANANTVGFKQSTAQFADVYAGSKVGLGTRVNSVVQSFTQGNIEASGRSLDVAITGGNGFFRMVGADGSVFFSRNGQFLRTDDGRITNAQGLQLTGYPAGVQPGGGVQPQPLVVSSAQMAPKATDRITAQYNLDSRGTAPTVPFTTSAGNPPAAAMFNYSSTIEVFDSLGNAQQVTAYFRKGATDATGTDWEVYVTDATGAQLSGPNAMRFDLNGALVTPAPGATIPVNVPAAGGAAAMNIQLDLAGTTQFGDDNDPKSIVQNGYTSGSLLGFSIEADGTILGSYSNEQTQSLGQVVMASFGNVEGLKPEGDNVWSATGASGQPLLGSPGGSMGQLQSNAVEASNVDLSGQLVNLIIAQRNYQANAQTIQAQDQVLQTLVNI
ncbi:flagellar hook protein FlgE [Cupriavidus sp. UGS-1]|uniref:flagellar hook protein FlgE n=1 Tax=Cupriavidus sp. UGS-1 TaxID=2899826 RepID=UPI001E4A04CF|nr:flagellar hook protein FlgE [Cupriavidus sp. UGS-1]MCD9119480.1 flagellar hook protein FlgE [Cupriavidus sp. UGS-1]